MRSFVQQISAVKCILPHVPYAIVRHPEIQEKVRNEVHKVVGTERQPTLADRANLPFTDATVLEIQRMANVCKSN